MTTEQPESRATVLVEPASPDAAGDAALMDRLARIVNEAYAASEGSLWAKRIERISRADFAATVARGEVGVAWTGDQPAGSIRLRRLDDSTFEFGVLAVAPDQRGAGVGDALVRWAEDTAREQGATIMELKLLEPVEGTHDFKVMLAGWYERLGYARVGGHPAEEGWPEAADELAVPCRFAVFQKPLT
jgi:GNAT superfamily N-acetyltransferase